MIRKTKCWPQVLDLVLMKLSLHTRDEKQYVETQVRQFSSLFIGTGLKWTW
jgi:hypothetical protein